LSFRVEHSRCGAPGQIFNVVRLTIFYDRGPEAPIGTICSSSPHHDDANVATGRDRAGRTKARHEAGPFAHRSQINPGVPNCIRAGADRE
jgi:hypothetical protein